MAGIAGLNSGIAFIIHNHPGGDSTPSLEDIRLTNEVVDAGKPLGIALHDHIVVGNGSHNSFRALGLI